MFSILPQADLALFLCPSNRLVGHFFVNFLPVSDGEDPDHSGLTVDRVTIRNRLTLMRHSPANSPINGVPANGSALSDRSACLMPLNLRG
jgi:hypothetical protein